MQVSVVAVVIVDPLNPESENNDSLSGAGQLLWDVPQYGNFGKTNDRDLLFAWMDAGVYSFETAPFCGQASDTILSIYRLRPDNNTSLLATNDNGGRVCIPKYQISSYLR